MATYYFQGQPIAAPFTIESKKIILASETASFKSYRRVGEGQRWDLSFNIITDNPQDIFDSMLDDNITVSSMTMPQLTTVDALVSNITSYPTVLEQRLAGQTSIALNTLNTGSYDSNTKSIPKSSFIQFSGHDKIYSVRSEVAVGASVTMTIFPALQATVNPNETVYLTNTPLKPQYTYRRSADQISGITFSDGILVDPGGIRLEEDV